MADIFLLGGCAGNLSAPAIARASAAAGPPASEMLPASRDAGQTVLPQVNAEPSLEGFASADCRGFSRGEALCAPGTRRIIACKAQASESELYARAP